jgi:hypothetical protein
LFAVGVVLVTSEKATGERIGIVTEEEEFHPSIGRDVVVVLEDAISFRGMSRQITGRSESFQGWQSFAFREECLTIVE